MSLLATGVILLHPIAALLVIRYFFNQRKWRSENKSLKSSEREAALQYHEEMGEKIFQFVLVVILLAFSAKFFHHRLITGDFDFAALKPSHFHGWSGILALALMFYLRKIGRLASERRSENQSFAKQRDLHGRISDVMAMLVLIHAFLGFLYLFRYL